MSSVAVAKGGGVAAGGIVASCQSAGAVGTIATSTSAGIATTGSAAVAGITRRIFRVFRKK